MLKDLQAFEYIEEQKWISFDLKSNLFLYLALEKCQGFNPSFFQLLKRQNLLNPHQFEELMDYLESLSLEKESFSEVQEKEEEPLPVEFGKFLLEAKIGQGGMGVIYRARQKDLKRVVALKVLRQDFENNPEQIHRFQREAEAMAKLKHKNIIAIYETGKVNNLPYFTMEYIDGHSLEELLDKNSLDLFSGLEIVESLARALDYAHSRGVIHRDIKPSNILIDKDNIPKLTDFGLAKNLDSHSLITHTGEIVGTVNYMSPEQALGQSRNMDGRSDIYSLSIILYQIACGRLPFQGDTTVETLRKIAEEDPLLPRKIRPTIPWEVEYIIMKGLEKQASHRYQHATDLADDIRRFLEGEAINIKGYSFWNRLLRKTEKYKALLIAASIAIFITILFLFEYHYSKIRIQKLQEATKKTMRRTRMEAAAFEAFMFLERGQPYFALEKLNQAIFQ
ncbi:MAG: serine/threonine protein kinase, partial [Planctomycetota bacterium]